MYYLLNAFLAQSGSCSPRLMNNGGECNTCKLLKKVLLFRLPILRCGCCRRAKWTRRKTRSRVSGEAQVMKSVTRNFKTWFITRLKWIWTVSEKVTIGSPIQFIIRNTYRLEYFYQQNHYYNKWFSVSSAFIAMTCVSFFPILHAFNISIIIW